MVNSIIQEQYNNVHKINCLIRLLARKND